MKKLNGKISKQGYKRNSPDNTNDFNIIPSGRISMHNVPHMVYGIDNLGNEKIMVPGEEYQFPGNQVTEIPMNKKQLGGGNNYDASSNFALEPSYLKNTVKQQKERELPMTAKQKKEIDKQQRLAAIKRDPRNYHVSDYINHGIPEPGLEESMSPLDLIGPAEGKIAMKLINRVASTGEKMLPKITNTINQAYKVNPWAFKPNPEAYYRMIGKEGYVDALKSGVIRPPQYSYITPQGMPKVGEQGIELINGQLKQKLPIPAYDEAYYNAQFPLDKRWYPENFPKFNKQGKRLRNGYEGPYMAEVNAEKHLFENGENVAAYIGPNASNTVTYSKEHIPITNPNVKFYKEDWLKGYKEVPKKQKGGGYFNPTLDPAFLQNTVQNFNQQEAKLTPQQKAELEKQRKLEYLKAHPEKYNVGYYQQYKKSEPGLEESVSPLDFLGPAEIKAVGKLASKAVGKLAKAGEKVLPKITNTIDQAYNLNPNRFKPNVTSAHRMIGDEEGLASALESKYLKPSTTGSDIGKIHTNTHYTMGAPSDGREYFGRTWNREFPGPYMVEIPNATTDIRFAQGPRGKEMGADVFTYPENYIPTSEANFYKKHWWKGYKEVPNTGSGAFQELTANSFPNPLAIADRIIPRTPTPLQYLGAEDSWNNYSPLNWIPGYGKKLSRDAELYHPSIKYNGKPALLDDIQGDLQPVGFRKFGNSLEDVIKRKVLGPKGGNRMGADQIVKEGNWAEPSKVNEHYSGLFEATMNPNVKGSNIKLEPWRNRRGIVGTTKEGNVDIPLTDPGLSFNRRLPFSNKYVSIDKQKLLDNEFQLATQLPHVQSLIEKYGIVAGQAAVFGYLAGGKEQAIKNLKTINKYSVDPVVNWTKKQWEDMNSSDFLKEHKELTKEKQGGSSGYTKGMKPANGKLFSNIVKQAKSRFKVLNTPTVKAWIDAQYHNAGGDYHYDYNTRQFGGDNNEINTIMKNNNLSKFTGHYQVGGAQQQIPLTPEQQYKKDHPDYGNDDLINQFDYSAKYIDSEGRVTIPRKKTNNSGFNQGTQQNFNNQKQDTSYMQEGDRYFQLYGDKKMPISNVSYMQAQKRLGLTPGLTPPTQYHKAFGGAPTANEFFDFGQQPPSFAFYQAGGAPTAEEFFNFGMQPPSFAFYGHGGESDCPECDAMMLDENVNEMKSGGNWIQGAVKHPGRCTPGSPNYDCPKGSPQWNLAQTFKKHHGFQKKQDGGGTDGNFNNINDAPQYAQDTFLNALKTQTQQALAKQEYENMEQMHQAFMQMGGNIPAQSLQWRDRSQDSPIQNMNELINPIVNRFDNDGQPNFGDNAYSESGVPTELTQRSNADKLLQSQYNAQQNAIAKAKAMGLGQFVYKQMGGNSLPKAQYGPTNYDPNAPMQNSYEVTPEMQWQSTANQIAFQPDNSEQQYEGDNPLGLDLSSQAYQPKRQDIGDDSPEEQLRFNGINGEVAANYEMAGINKLSEYLERKQREPYEDKLKQRQNADAVFTPVGANMNSRGDYDVNSGMFRPDQMVPIQNRGYAKFGGGYQSGGEYYMSDDEIQQILDAGGQVEYLED